MVLRGGIQPRGPRLGPRSASTAAASWSALRCRAAFLSAAVRGLLYATGSPGLEGFDGGDEPVDGFLLGAGCVGECVDLVRLGGDDRDEVQSWLLGHGWVPCPVNRFLRGRT